jgi:spore maturation protein CgeB
MRILVAGPRFPDSFADNVACALEGMGHEAVTVQEQPVQAYWSLPRRLARLATERILGNRPKPEDHVLLRLARRARPDVLLALTWDIHPEVLEDMRILCGGRRVLWWGDVPANSQRWGLANPGWDRVYTKDATAVSKLQLAGRSAGLLHEAMNPRWHRPIAARKSDAVIVAGNYYALRQAILARLLRAGVPLELYGPRPPRWSDPEIAGRWSGKYVTREDKSRVFGEGMACLNTFAFSETNSLNCRAFEIAGAGGLQLVERRPALEQCFSPGEEVLAFETFEELLAHIERARRAPAEVERIRQAGARRALAEHTYRHRLEKILADLA